MTLANCIALFGVMLVLAAIPSVSVLTVSARSAAFGFSHGLLVTAGIVMGDVLFILLAVFGLAVLTEAMDSLFVVIKYIGGIYLIWLGIQFWRAQSRAVEGGDVQESSLVSSFMAGLLITLADQKAILFYLVFFPVFIDLARLSYIDAAIVIVCAALAIGMAKLAYAYAADRASLLLQNRNAIRKINLLAGTIMIIVGLFLLLKP